MTSPHELSFQSAKWKINGTNAYCGGPHLFFDNAEVFLKEYPSIPENAMVGVYDRHAPKKLIGCGKLIEVVTYIDGSIHLLLLKQTSELIDLALPTSPPSEPVNKYSLSFICTADEPYISILKDTLEFYRTQVDLSRVEVCVVMFGKTELPDWVKVKTEPDTMFHMSYARNKCLAIASNDHVFMLDVDVRITSDQLNEIINIYQTVPNHGVLNLKSDYKMGNGLYFGNKAILQRNGYDERFKKFWFEDTEFLMNFSRIGIVPMIVFIPFIRVDHNRKKTLANESLNLKLMTEIVNNGSRKL